MHLLKLRGIRAGLIAALALAVVAVGYGVPSVVRNAAASGTNCGTSSAPDATAVPPGAPDEDVCDANAWPAPNGDLYNTRDVRSAISSHNVSQLAVAWTLPLQGMGVNGYDFANPVVSHGTAYLQDGASNVMAVRVATGQVLWTHTFNSKDYGPNGVTLANGRLYGVTATGVFALDAQTGTQVWYNTQLAATPARFGMPPQVANGKVFVASALTVGGGILYALDAQTGATLWQFQTVVDPVGQQLRTTAGGAWDAVLIGPDDSVYVGTGNPYLTLQQAVTSPSRELYTDSLVKLDQATGDVEWYYQAFPDDFHDWDLQISPIYTVADGRPVVLAAGKGGFVFAFDPSSGQLLWKTSVGLHNGHDNDDQLALEGQLTLQAPYTLLPGEIGGVETNMAAADGVVYVPVVNAPTTYPSATSATGVPDLANAGGEMDAIDIATGKVLWTTTLPRTTTLPPMPLGGATVSNDLVLTTTFTGEVVALSRTDGAVVWTAQLPAGSNATLAIVGNLLLAGAGLPLSASQHPSLVAYRLDG